MEIKAIIVDDEALDRDLLQELLHRYCDHIHVVATAVSVMDALPLIEQVKPDVVFLDIHMPTGSGFELMQHIPERDFLVVFTTGHNEFGIQAVKAGAFDYLMKPIDVDELIGMEEKMLPEITRINAVHPSRLCIYHNRERSFVETDDVICIEAEGSYARLFLIDGSERLVSKNITQLIKDFPNHQLHRVHRSFVINPKHIIGYKTVGNECIVDLTSSVQARVSRKYRNEFKQLLG
jgi:two-component system, LytTR family, response regulator